MKIGIQTWGSNGDVRPFLALGDGLRKAGHDVALVATSVDNRSYQDVCDELGIGYRQAPEHIVFDMEGFTERSLKMNSFQWMKALVEEAFLPFEQEMYRAAQDLVAENDYVIGRHILYPLKLAALKQHKPFFSVTFCHSTIPSGQVAPAGVPNLGRYLNPLYWQLFDGICNWAFKDSLTRLWHSEGEKPPKNVMSELLTSQQLNLIASDPIFCNGSEHWQSFNQVCGFLEFTEDAQHWEMPQGLQAFLQQGPAPVYLTLGSIQQSVPEWSMDVFLQAVELAGCRAIIQTSSERFAADTQTENVYFIGRHPHQPVFERCAVVVHHGGAGTTHAASRAGCPSVVIPFMDEQLFWGQQLQKLGMSVKPLPFKNVTAKSLGAALRTILGNPSYRTAAQRVRLSMQRHDGVAKAIELLNAHCGQKSQAA